MSVVAPVNVSGVHCAPRTPAPPSISTPRMLSNQLGSSTSNADATALTMGPPREVSPLGLLNVTVQAFGTCAEHVPLGCYSHPRDCGKGEPRQIGKRCLDTRPGDRRRGGD